MDTMQGMRVVAGSAKGRKLVAPTGDAVRPTTDRVREAIGNVLTSMGSIDGARVIDLFAGSGALGIEVLSRGAASATFIEPNRSAREATKANLFNTGFEDPHLARVISTGAEQHLIGCARNSYDLALADPPYAYDEWPALFALLDEAMAKDGVVVVESDRRIEPPPGWEIFRERRYGSTVVTINVRTEAPLTAPGAET